MNLGWQLHSVGVVTGPELNFHSTNENHRMLVVMYVIIVVPLDLSHTQ